MSKIVTSLFLCFVVSGLATADELDEKLRKAYMEGYRVGYSTGYRDGQIGSTGNTGEKRGELLVNSISGGTRSGLPVIGGSSSPGTAGYELPDGFAVENLIEQKSWDLTKIQEALNGGQKVKAHGYSFNDGKITYGETPIYIDATVPNKLFVQGAGESNSGAWSANSGAIDMGILSEILELQGSGIKHGVVFEGIMIE